jgi:tetratricopeptide (TPR) repeat protein
MAGDNIASEGVARRAMVLLAGKSRLEFAPIALIALGNLQRFDEVRTLMVGLASEQREHTSDQDWRRCLIHAAQCETFAGNYQEARRLLDQAASNGVATLRGGNLGLYLSARAVLDNILDCPFPALEQFSRALAIFESRGDVKNAAFVMADLAFIEGECGLLENAHVTTGRAMEKFREAGLQGSVALLYANAAQAHFYGDRLPEAKRDASEAVRLTKGQDHRVEGLALGTLARVAAREGEGPLAVQLAIQAVERHRLLPTYLSGSLAVLARANLANHAHSESHRAATEAWQLLRATGASESLEALVRCVYVESRLASGDSAAAVAALAEACNWLRGRLVGIRSPADRSAFRAFEDHKRLCELAQIYGLADPIIEKGNAPL